jgi:hypothetical protein
MMTLSVMACGGDDVHHIEDPQPAAGGGVQEAPIKGELNVFVIDEDTDQPISGATVQVDAEGLEAPLTGQTDATGFVVFKEAKLDGAVTVTARNSGYRISTWMGAEGAVVTIPLASEQEPDVPTASASGTIAGWDALPAPPMNHLTFAFVQYSFTSDLGDPANEIQQPGGQGLPPNACVKAPPGLPVGGACNWSLVTRTGAQSIYAVILDVDTKGNFQDQSQWTYAYQSFAIKSGLNLSDGQSLTGVTLDIVADPPESITVTLPALPAGLTQVAGFPMVRLGDELFPFVLTPFDSDNTTSQVPPLAGALASGQYDIVVRASGMADGPPESIALVRDVDPAGTIDLGALLPLPGNLSATGGTYSFEAVAGATLHIAGIEDMTGERWNVALLDGRTSFTLPVLATDPLAAGMYELHVSAIQVAGFDPKDFVLDDLTDKFDRVCEGFIAFTK